MTVLKLTDLENSKPARQLGTRVFSEPRSQYLFAHRFGRAGIVETVSQRRQPAVLNVETLLNRIDLPLEWPAQLKAIEID